MHKQPKQILADNKHIQWNVQDLGMLLRLKLVRGVKQHRSSLIYEPDVVELWQKKRA